MVAILAGAAVGNVLGDRPSDLARQRRAERAREAETQRRLADERRSALPPEDRRQPIEDPRLFEVWKRRRAASSAMASTR